MTELNLRVVAAGARTALGQSLLQTCFLLRTGIPAISESALANADAEAVTMAFDPTLGVHEVGLDRMLALGTAALDDAFGSLPEASSIAQLASLRTKVLVVSSGGTEHPQDVARALSATLESRVGKYISPVDFEVVSQGSAALAFLLPRCAQQLQERQYDALLVLGIHSDYCPGIIQKLEAEGRLFSPERPYTVIPGEAAAAVLFMRPGDAKRYSLPEQARVLSAGSGLDAATATNDESVFKADGFLAATRSSLTGGGVKVSWGFGDLGFEAAPIRQWHTVMSRCVKHWEAPMHFDSPPQRLGRLGASALPLFVALCAESWRRECALGDHALAFAASANGERGAIVMAGG